MRSLIRIFFLYTLFCSFHVIAQQKSSEIGKCLTPRGELRVLCVYVNFSDYQPEPNNLKWPSSALVPEFANDGSVFFSDFKQFAAIPEGNLSVPRFYYDMTNQLPEEERFKVVTKNIGITVDGSKVRSFSELDNSRF